MSKDQKEMILRIIKRIIFWGIGAISILFGLCTMTLKQQIGIDWPDYLIIGMFEVCIGVLLYIYDREASIREKKLKMKGD